MCAIDGWYKVCTIKGRENINGSYFHKIPRFIWCSVTIKDSLRQCEPQTTLNANYIRSSFHQEVFVDATQSAFLKFLTNVSVSSGVE